MSIEKGSNEKMTRVEAATLEKIKKMAKARGISNVRMLTIAIDYLVDNPMDEPDKKLQKEIGRVIAILRRFEMDYIANTNRGVNSLVELMSNFEVKGQLVADHGEYEELEREIAELREKLKESDNIRQQSRTLKERLEGVIRKIEPQRRGGGVIRLTEQEIFQLKDIVRNERR